jgi:transcriptional regulator with XRE-family HTH domain
MAKKQTIGQRIKTERIAKGWTQEILALRCHVCVKTVSAWECDRSLPSMPSRVALAKLLGIEN